MKKKEPDLVRELESLLEEYNPYKEADISFLLRQMMMKGHARYGEFRKKVDKIRRAYREGRLKRGTAKTSGLA